jgi:hypothetical protein
MTPQDEAQRALDRVNGLAAELAQRHIAKPQGVTLVPFEDGYVPVKLTRGDKGCFVWVNGRVLGPWNGTEAA